MKFKLALLWLASMALINALQGQGAVDEELWQVEQWMEQEVWSEAAAQLPVLLVKTEGENKALAHTFYGHVQRRMGSLDSALWHHQQALLIRRSYCGEASRETGASLHNLGNVHWQRGNFNEAGEALHLALRLFEQQSLDTMAAKVANSLGVLFQDQSLPDSSRFYLQYALDLWQAALGEQSIRTLPPLINLANSLPDTQGLKYLNQGLELVKNNEMSPDEQIALLWFNLGNRYFDNYQLDSAQWYYEQAYDFYKKNGLIPLEPTASTALALGRCAQQSDQDETAEFWFRKGLAVLQAQGFSHPFTMAALHQALAQQLAAKGEWTESQQNQLQSINYLRNAQGETTLLLGEALGNLGLLYLEEENYPAALHYLAAAYYTLRGSVYTKAFERFTLQLARAKRLGDDAQEAVALLEQLSANDEDESLPLRLEWGLTRLATKEWPTAEAHFRYVLQEAENKVPFDPWIPLKAHWGLAFSLEQQAAGDPMILQQAYRYCEEGLHQLSRYFAVLPEEMAVRKYRYRADELYCLAIRLALQLGEEDDQWKERAFYWAEHSKALTLSVLDQQTKLMEELEHYQLRQRYRKWQRYYFTLLESSTYSSADALSEAIDSLFHLRQQLGELSKGPFLDIDLPTIADLQKNINSDEALLSFFSSEDQAVAFIITSSDFRTEEVPGEKELQAPISTYFRLASNSPWSWPSAEQDSLNALMGSLSEELYDALWRPFVSELKEKVCLFPDGLLHYVPFQSLRQSETGLFVGQQFELAEDFAVSINRLHPSERTGDSDRASTLLALAPDFDEDSTGLAPLTFNQAEVKLLKARYQGHFLIGQEGTEDAYWAQEFEADVIHFSTHGLLNDRFPALSALAFTEQRDTTENERLFTGEIRETWRKRQLVVLSACETAAGPLYRGEGLLSLARSFYQSGTENIVATRWRVDDELSSRLMGLFYEQLGEGHSSVTALQRAQRIYLEEEGGIHQHPYFWAAYTHIGPGAQVNLPQRNRWWVWGTVFGLLLLVLRLQVVRPVGKLKRKRPI